MSAPTPSTGAARRGRGSTRAKMLESAAEVLRERGAAGVTIDEVLARSGAPRGSVYYHFPEGRSQILQEALKYAGDSITEGIDKAADQSATVLLHKFVQIWEQLLTESGYTAGCPVMAAAIGPCDDELHLPAVAAEIFARWRESAKQAFIREGFDPADAAALSNTTLAALEGAVVLCRSTRSLEPLHDVAAQMEFLIRAREFVARFGIPALSD